MYNVHIVIHVSCSHHTPCEIQSVEVTASFEALVLAVIAEVVAIFVVVVVVEVILVIVAVTIVVMMVVVVNALLWDGAVIDTLVRVLVIGKLINAVAIAFEVVVSV